MTRAAASGPEHDMSDREMSDRTLLDVFFETARSSPELVATVHIDAAGVERETTWSQWEARSRALAVGLLGLGLEPGARVAVLSQTRVEWVWLDVAIQMAGGISVPIFPNELPANCERLLRDSGARVVVAEDPWQLQKLLEMSPELVALLTLVIIDEEMTLASGATLTASEFGVRGKRILTLAQVEARGDERLMNDERALTLALEGARADGCVSICYTPGTAGREKGVMLTHENFVTVCDALHLALELSPADRQLLYLPLAQAFARTSLWVAVRVGMTTAFARSYRTVFEDARRLLPTFLCGVPRLFERAQEAVARELLGAGGLTTLVSGWGLEGEGEGEEGFFARAKRELAQRMVRRKLAQFFGGRLRFVYSGGAPLGVETARFFHAHGVPLLEGYGMVETCAVSHIQRLGLDGVGNVGRPLPGVEFTLLEDGELLLRGANITPGYWGNAEATREVFDDEGWFHTGDLARVDARGCLVITDRKRDIIVTANGKAIAPQPIAERLRADSLIEQALIHGDRQTFLTALISLDPESLGHFAAERGLEGDFETLTRHATVFAHIDAVIDRVNATLAPHENIKKFAILHRPLSVEEGDLTPTRRLRRRVAADKHRALLDSFYSEQF